MDSVTSSDIIRTIVIGTALVVAATVVGFVLFMRWSGREREKAERMRRIQSELSQSQPDEP